MVVKAVTAAVRVQCSLLSAAVQHEPHVAAFVAARCIKIVRLALPSCTVHGHTATASICHKYTIIVLGSKDGMLLAVQLCRIACGT